MRVVVSAETVADVNNFFVSLRSLGGIVEMKTKNFIIGEIIALVLCLFGFFMRSSDFFRELLGYYAPGCSSSVPGVGCPLILSYHSEFYGKLLESIGFFLFFILLAIFIISKIIKIFKHA